MLTNHEALVGSSANHCEVMASVANSTLLFVILTIQLAASLLSIPALVVTIRKVIRFQLLHRSTRFLLLLYLMGYLLHSASRIVLNSEFIIRTRTTRGNGCDMLPSLVGCFAMRLPLNFSIFLISTSTPVIAIERLISTLKIDSYEHYYKAGPYLALFQMTISSALLYVLSHNTVFSGRVIYYCLSTTAGSLLYSFIPLGLTTILQLMAVILMKALSVFNKRTAARLQQYPDLRSQYNVSENLRTITIVLPVCAASAIFITSFYVAGVIGFKFGHPGNTIMLYVLTEGALLLPYSALVFPLIFDRLIKHSANANKVGLEVHMALDVKDSNHHFAAMAHAWDATFTARERRASA